MNNNTNGFPDPVVPSQKTFEEYEEFRAQRGMPYVAPVARGADTNLYSSSAKRKHEFVLTNETYENLKTLAAENMFLFGLRGGNVTALLEAIGHGHFDLIERPSKTVSARDFYKGVSEHIRNRDSSLCFYCKQYTELGVCAHIIPHTKGGPAIPANAVWAHASCNNTAYNFIDSEWVDSAFEHVKACGESIEWARGKVFLLFPGDYLDGELVTDHTRYIPLPE